MARKKIWNYGNKRKRGNFTDDERKLSTLLDDIDNEGLMEISKYSSDISMPKVNCEKLAWSVIDKAELFDEEERERRRIFERKIRQKRMIHGIIGCVAVAVLILILALCGVFDRVALKYYDTSILEAEVYSADEEKYAVAEPGVDHEYQVITTKEIVRNKEKQEVVIGDGAKKLTAYAGDFPKVDSERLENTIYKVIEKYCSQNDYAVDEQQITKQGSYQDKDGNPYLVVEVCATCIDYKKKEDGVTWGELDTYDKLEDRYTGDLSWTTDLSSKTYVIFYTIAIKI